MQIKSLADAENWIKDYMGDHWEGLFYPLNETQENVYRYKQNQTGFTKNMESISFKQLVKEVYRNRKNIASWYCF